jgi:hypothetical protein
MCQIAKHTLSNPYDPYMNVEFAETHSDEQPSQWHKYFGKVIKSLNHFDKQISKESNSEQSIPSPSQFELPPFCASIVID